jgi:hypothetical protein
MKKDALKKHHFWLMVGSVPLLILILFILLQTEPAGAIEKATTDFNNGLKATNDAKPPGKGWITDLEVQKAELEKRRDDLWKANYERQRDAGVFKWPRVSRDPTLEAFEKLDLRFGAKKVESIDPSLPAIITDRQFVERNDEIEKLAKANNYLEAYKALAESVGPTMFEKANWMGVLRFVTDWKTGRPPIEQLWLAIEDYWVQKALLAPIAEVNASIAKFDLVPVAKGAPDDPKKFHFRSRIWDLNLELATESGATVLKSKLKNRTDRLQLLGIGKSMKLKVWLDDPSRGAQPFEYRIEGEVVKGNEEITPRFVLALHRLPAGSTTDRIWKVEQVFDTSTVPIRVVRRIDLGYTDSKRAGTELKVPKFLEDPAPAPGTTPSSDTSTQTPSLPRGSDLPLTGPGIAGVAPPSGPKTGTHEEVLLGNKKRYLEVNEQIRRMPVAIVVVVDQAYVNDLLVAYSNSPLRFLETQVQQQRFRDNLPVPLPATSGTPSPAPPVPMRPGEGFPPPGGASSASVSESQAAAGLTEVAIYGIVTFYEKYYPKAAPTPPVVAPAPVPAPVPAPMPPKP